MADLPTNFKDDILDTSVNTRRRYRMYENTDGTIELEDVTEYSQVGNEFGAGQINETNTEVNKKFDKNMLVRDLDTINAITKEGYAPDALALKEVNESLGNLKFAQDAEGNWGYIPSGADAVIPFKSFSGIDSTHKLTVTSNSVSKSIIDMNGYANAIILDYKNQWNFSSVSNGTVSVNNNMACSAPNGSSAGNAKLLIITNITDDTITINRGGTGTGSNAEPIAYGF